MNVEKNLPKKMYGDFFRFELAACAPLGWQQRAVRAVAAPYGVRRRPRPQAQRDRARRAFLQGT